MNLPIYPVIKLEKTAEKIKIIGQKEVTLSMANDLFFVDGSLFFILRAIADKEITRSHKLYKYCNALIYDQFQEAYCIYDPKDKRWLVIAEDNPDFEWTNNRYDENITLFNKELVDEFVPYDYCVIQTRKMLNE